MDNNSKAMTWPQISINQADTDLGWVTRQALTRWLKQSDDAPKPTGKGKKGGALYDAGEMASFIMRYRQDLTPADRLNAARAEGQELTNEALLRNLLPKVEVIEAVEKIAQALMQEIRASGLSEQAKERCAERFGAVIAEVEG